MCTSSLRKMNNGVIDKCNMENTLYRHRYRIPSARAAWHNYDGGIFFVTICTKNKTHYFGTIVNGCRDDVYIVSTGMDIGGEAQMQLSPLGNCVVENLQNVTEHYPYASIPLFVVMPNHVHAIVVIDGEKIPYNRDVETMCTSSLSVRTQHWKTDVVNDKMQIISHERGALSVVIGGLKRAVTHFARENGFDFAWQTRFHDRIVRNQDELNRIMQYIENNVANWQNDALYHN